MAKLGRGILLYCFCLTNLFGLWAQKAMSARQVRDAMGLESILPNNVIDPPQAMLDRVAFLQDSLRADSSSEISGQLAWFRAEALYRQANYQLAAKELGQLLNRLELQGAPNTLLLRASLVLHGLALEFYSIDTESARLLLEAYSLASNVQDKRLMFDIGVVFARWAEELEDLEDAVLWLNNSEALAAELQNARCFNRLYNRKSSILRQLEEPDSALIYANKALEWGKKAGPDNELATTYLILGLIHYPQGIEPSKQYFQLGAAENKKGGDHSFVWNILGLARLYTRHKDYPLAKNYIDSIQAVLPTLNFPMFIPELDNTLQSYYLAVGEKDSVIKYKELYYEGKLALEGGKRQVELEVAGNEFMRQRQQMHIRQQQLEIDQTENERRTLFIVAFSLGCAFFLILFLAIRLRIRSERIREQNLLIQSINQSLEKNVQEKEVLLKEVNHRVKNNLQMIGTFLDLQEVANGDPGLKPVLEGVRYRIRAMALVHELILDEQDVEALDFGHYMNALVGQLSKMSGADTQLAWEVNCVDLRLDLSTTMNLGIMINELCLNTIQHGQVAGRKLKISISLKKEGDGNQLTFCDNGPGLSSKVDFEHAKSTGLYLIKAMGQQLDGKVSYAFEEGACFRLTF